MMKAKERGKWLAALALCLTCLTLCATIMVAPTLAEPAAFKAVNAFKNVYERLDAQGNSKAVKEFFYASSAKPGEVYQAALKEETVTVEGAAVTKYTLKADVYGNDVEVPAARDLAVKADGTLDTAYLVPPQPGEVGGAQRAKVAQRINLYEALDAAGQPRVPGYYTYASGENDQHVRAYKQDGKFYLQLTGGIYIAVAADGTLDCNDVIDAGTDKSFGNSDDKILFPAKTVTPTTPPPTTGGKYKAVADYKNLYEWLDANGNSKLPKEYFYNALKPGEAGSFQAIDNAGKFVIYLRDGESIRELPLKKNGTLDTANPAPPTEAPAAGWPVLKAVAQRTNIYEKCDKDGKSLSPVQYVYACSETAKNELPVAVYKIGEKFYIHQGSGKYLGNDKPDNDGYIAVAADGTLNTNDVILTAVGKKPSADAVVLFPVKNAAGWKYKKIEGFQNLYEVLDGNGNARDPREFILSDKAPEDGKEPLTGSRKAYAKGNEYYCEILTGSGIFLAVDTDGTGDMTKVIWWGKDGKFGTDDDLDTSVKEEGGYYFWKQADGLWKTIEGLLDPNKTTSPSQSSSSTDNSSTTQDAFLNGSNPNLVKTGKDDSSNTGVAVCMALLAMGCAYCAYQALRRKRRI